MLEFSTNNRRIAKNTLFLYLRMGLSMIVSLYTSRVVLQTLGVVDYGVYGVVGGVVAMFGFLNASMAGATSRFLTYELGKGDDIQLHKTFCMAFYEHLIIAAILLLICETVGLWFLNTKLEIPPERLSAAKWVYQLSVLSMLITVTQVPYNASIISHEQMDIYAYVEMLKVGLRLLNVYLLRVLLYDKLMLYATLVFVVTAGIAMFYRYYCLRNFQECRLKLLWDKTLMNKMLSFSGWDLYGNMSVMARTQGVNMLLNMFFGPTVNAASAIATQVQGKVLAFVTTVSTAVKPQIIKYYAQGNYKEMVRLISNAIRLNYLILMFITVPLLVELPYILHLWLGVVPEHTVVFTSFTLLFNFFGNMSYIMVTGVHATGKILRPSFINGTLYLMVLPFTYIAFKSGFSVWWPYVFNVAAVVLGMLSNAYTLHLYVGEFSLRSFFKKDFFPCIVILGSCVMICLFLKSITPDGFLGFLTTLFLSTVILMLSGYFFLVPKSLSMAIIHRFSKICKKD